MTARQDRQTSIGAGDDTVRAGKLGGSDILLPADRHRPWPLRAHIWQPAGVRRGWFVILPGFTEFCEKYALTARRLVRAGFACLIIDWPGQGRSGHLGAHPALVHIDDFSSHLQAFDELLDAASLGEQSFFVLGHSMGGHLGLQIAARYPENARALILLAPMIVPLAPPVWLTRALAGGLSQFGWHRHRLPFTRIPSVQDRRRFRIDNVLTRYPEGYDRQYQIFETCPELRRACPTVGWVAAAFRACAHTSLNADWMRGINLPVLSLLAADERVVDLPKAVEMLSYLPGNEMVMFDNARHELLNELPETVRRLFSEIDKFVCKAEQAG